jgi:hypothetical protein
LILSVSEAAGVASPTTSKGDEKRKRCRQGGMAGRRGLGKRRCELGPRLGEGARDHHGDVILLFTGAELADCCNDCLEQRTYRKMTIGTKGVN